jgi:putative oxidoreductase
MSSFERITPAFGRLLIAVLFLLSGFGKIAAPAATKGFIAAAGLPMPDLAYLVAILFEVGISLCFLLGYRTRLVAILMALFTLATALAFHTNFGDQNAMNHFLKNIAIVGGFLQTAVLGGGALSIDAWLARSPSAVPRAASA